MILGFDPEKCWRGSNLDWGVRVRNIEKDCAFENFKRILTHPRLKVM